MNITGILGLLGGVGLLVYGILVEEGGDLMLFYSLSSIFITVGGTVAALVISFPWKTIKTVPFLTKLVFFPPKYDPLFYIGQMVEYAKIARTKSLLALEDSANECKDAFMKSSLMLIVDANDSERVKEMLDDAIDFMCERHDVGRSFFEKASAIAPGFGMIGTLIGLINMLANLADPSGIASGMSVALITTFYGCVMAHLLCSPMATRLKHIHDDEVLCMQIVEEGALAIISGANPRYIQEKLEFMLPKKKGKGNTKAEKSSK